MFMMWKNQIMITMVSCPGLSLYILHTLFLLSSLMNSYPDCILCVNAKMELPPHYACEDNHSTFTYKLWIIDHFLQSLIGNYSQIMKILVSFTHSMHQVQQLSATKVFAHNNLLELCYSITMSERHFMIVNQLLKQPNECVSYSWSCFSEFNPTVYTSGWSMPLGFLLCD